MARRLLDSELLNAEFRFRDPETTIAGLHRDRPDANAGPTIVGYYDERPAGGRASNLDAPFVWCCHCQRHTHWEGYVVRDDSGRTYIIGNECGRKHYGGQFIQVEKRFNEEQLRKIMVTRWIRIVAELSRLEAALTSIASDPYLVLHDAKQAELRNASPRAFNRLRNAVRRGALELHERIRDVAEEVAREERYRRALQDYRALPYKERKKRQRDGLAPEQDTTPIYRNVSRNLGHVVGTSILGLSDLRTAASRVRRSVDAMRAADELGTDAHETKTLIQLRKDVVESGNALREELIVTSFCELFFEKDNLDRLEAWSSLFRDFHYSRRGAKLLVWDRDEGEALIYPIASGHIEALQLTERFNTTVVEDDLEAAGAVVAENQNDPLSRRFVA